MKKKQVNQQQRYLFTVVLTLIIFFFNWNVGYDAVCGLATNCNRGINPTTLFGFPFVIRQSGIYTLENINSMNVLLTLVFYGFLSYIIISLLMNARKSK